MAEVPAKTVENQIVTDWELSSVKAVFRMRCNILALSASGT